MLLRLENAPTGVSMIAPTQLDATLAVSTTTPAPSPTPTPTPTTACYTQQQYCTLYPNSYQCGDSEPTPGARICMPSPVILDVAGNGFALTDTAHGVRFDMDADGLFAERISWTAPNSDDAFLFLDRNGDGVVNNGLELFGDMTVQSQSDQPNGFLALAEYDKPVNGGTGDGVINRDDAVFPELRLWQDKNHNGISEPNEVHTLSELGIEAISLEYKESRRIDQNSNVFRYRAKVYGTNHSDTGRWAYDVLLVSTD
jgi:hypothetical protein